MPVPDYESLMFPLLRGLADGAEHHARDLREKLATEMKLTANELAERLPSGKQSVFDNRVGWAKTYMDKAGLVTTVRRGVYRITEAGKKLLGEKPARLDKKYLERFEPFRAFLALQHHDEGSGTGADASGVDPSATPEEQLEAAHRRIRQRVESEVLQAVMNASPQFFEKLVVELLMKMGYGGLVPDAGEVSGRPGDGGVDGVIKEDQLGLDVIYLQAKRWQKTVGRPDLQEFAGSLLGRRGRKGVFITTSAFSRDAYNYVGQIDSKIVLIDGAALAELMVDHGVGVSTVTSYEVKRVDTDYFSEE